MVLLSQTLSGRYSFSRNGVGGVGGGAVTRREGTECHPPLYRGAQRGCPCWLANLSRLPPAHPARKLASLSRTFPDDKQERHFGTENQKLSSYKEENKSLNQEQSWFAV